VKWRLGVVGSPISHSLSPQLHEAGLRILGLEGTSERVEVARDETDRLRNLIEGDFDALSVTMPLKHVASAVCGNLHPSAARTGSVNSLLRKGDVTYGRSTDGDGFVNSVMHDFDFSLASKNVAVLGSGGAASAIVDALVRHNVGSIALLARNEGTVHGVVEKYPNVLTEIDATTHLDLVVNTVPVSGEAKSGLLSPEILDETTICVDIGYEPRTTPWLHGMRALGCRSANGLSMLAHQAQLQMQWWFNESLPIEDLLGVIE